MKIGVVDYKAGNLRSVENLLRYLDADYIISGRGEELIKCDKLLFPGVGEASYAMNQLKSSGLDTMMREFCKSGKHIFGICLGCQIILEHSEEGDVDCLGIFDTDVKRFIPQKHEDKVPHMGWNSITDVKEGLFNKQLENQFVYFVHSFYVPVNDFTAATTDYIHPFSASLHKDNFYATQFHPEKSGQVGEVILHNFLNL